MELESIEMKFSVLSQAITPLFLSAVLLGCASAPTQEMSDARQSVKAARDAEADKHTPEAFSSAEDLLSKAEKELSAHSYKPARKHALSSKKEAIKARNMAHAIGQAKAAVAEAIQLNALSKEAGGLLEQAEAAARLGDEAQAVKLAGEARKVVEEDVKRGRAAKLAAEQEQERFRLNQAHLDKAKWLIDDIKQLERRMNAEQRAALAEVELAYRNGEGAKAYDLAGRLLLDLDAALQPKK